MEVYVKLIVIRSRACAYSTPVVKLMNDVQFVFADVELEIYLVIF